MINVQVFADRYPEMRAIALQNPGFVNSTLAESDRQIHVTVPGRDDLIMLATAAALARSPMGRAAQMVDKSGESAYSLALKSAYEVLALGDRFL